MKKWAFTLAVAWICSGFGGYIAAAEAPALSTSVSQPASEAPLPLEYERLVQLGFTEFEAGNYAEARSRFADAYASFPNARVLRALGKTEYELKNYAAAVRAFEGALRSQVRALTPEQRADTEQMLREVRRYLVRFEITTTPATAALWLDGQTLEREPDGSVSIAVGDHVLEAQLHDYQTARRVLHVLGGADQKLGLLLLPLVTSKLASGERVDTQRPLYKRWWLWTAVGVVAAGAITSAIFLTRDPGVGGFHRTTTGLLVNVPSPVSAR